MNERRTNDVIANVISQSSCLNTVMANHESDGIKLKVMIVEKQAQHDNKNIHHPLILKL